MRIVISDASPESQRVFVVPVINTEALTDDDKKAIDFVTEQLKKALANLDQRVRELNRGIKQRESAGLILKVGTVVIGVLVASGLLQHVIVQALGVLVLIIVGIEQTYGNLEKLKIFTSARNAYSRIRREVQAIHDDQLAGVIRDKARRPMDSANRLIELNRRLMKLLSDTQQMVETAIEEKQFALLDRLTLTDQAKQITPVNQTSIPVPAET